MSQRVTTHTAQPIYLDKQIYSDSRANLNITILPDHDHMPAASLNSYSSKSVRITFHDKNRTNYFCRFEILSRVSKIEVPKEDYRYHEKYYGI